MIEAGRRNTVIYLVYPRSFADSNGDGIGDIDGITARLDHIAGLGVDAVWLAPMFASPQADMGYDVSDYLSVAPEYGDLAAMDQLIARAHHLGLGVLLDIVPCHTSIEHSWFREHPEWYIIRDTPEPPNNWVSVFEGPAWHRDPYGRGWYLHTFYPEQPNLNWRNPELVAAMHDVLRFWFDRGVDGFRIDALDKLFVDEQLRDEPPATSSFAIMERPEYGTLAHIHTSNQPEIFSALGDLRATFPDRYFITEAYRPLGELHEYLAHADASFCFELQQADLDVERIAGVIRDAAGVDGVAWMLSNHDFPRLSTSWGEEMARAAAALLLTLPGTAVIYQGDEIGMVDGPGIHPPVDRVGRDAYRHPMQWTRDGGFSDAGPWLPMINPEECNVADQGRDGASMLALYRDLIALRAEMRGPVSNVHVRDGVLHFERGAHHVDINMAAHPAARISRGERVFSTHPGESKNGTLPPHCAAVFATERSA